MYFGNKDTGMHTGYSWPGQRPRDTGPELCVITGHMDANGHLQECEQPESAPVHQRGYADGGHQFTSEAMAAALDEAEYDAGAAYDAAMTEHGY